MFGYCCYFLLLWTPRLTQEKVERRRRSICLPPPSLGTLFFSSSITVSRSFLAEMLETVAKVLGSWGPGSPSCHGLPWMLFSLSELQIWRQTVASANYTCMLASWGAHSEIVESSLRKPRKYFELIYHTSKMLWEKWQDHLFAACCRNADLLRITLAKISPCYEPALHEEICFSLLYSNVMGLPSCGPSSEIAFCVTAYVGFHKIWTQWVFLMPCWAVTLLSHRKKERSWP